MAGPFKLKGHTLPGPNQAAPLKDKGHGGKKGHGHTTVFGTKVEDIEDSVKKAAKGFWKAAKKHFKAHDPFPNVAIGKDIAKATEDSLTKQAKGQTVGFSKY